MREPRNRANGASDVWALKTAYSKKNQQSIKAILISEFEKICLFKFSQVITCRDAFALKWNCNESNS